jgi:hypothetical protein
MDGATITFLSWAKIEISATATPYSPSFPGSLFDQLVSPRQQRVRHSQAESIRRSQVDDQLEPGRLLNRQRR